MCKDRIREVRLRDFAFAARAQAGQERAKVSRPDAPAGEEEEKDQGEPELMTRCEEEDTDPDAKQFADE